MKTIFPADLCYTNTDFIIEDIFPESWIQRKEFSLYKKRPRPSSALFFVCSDIEVSFFLDDGSVFARKGDVVFIPKGASYYVKVSGSTSGRIDTYTVNFHLFDEQKEPLLLAEKISVLASREDTLFDVRLKKLSDIFHTVKKNGGSEKRNFARIKGEFFLLLDLISESDSRRNDFYYPIRKGVEAFSNEWNLNEKIEKYAEICGMSETYFYRCFRKWSGSTPVEYRNMLRLANAESMLRCTDMKIKEISETVGFEDPFYFCRIFSQKFGTSPHKYRKHILN